MRKTQAIKLLYPYLKKDAPKFILATVATLISVAFTLTVPILFGFAIDQMIGEGKVTLETLSYYLTLSAGCIAIVCFAEWVKDFMNAKVVAGVTLRLRNACAEKLHRLPLKYLDNRAVGDTVGVVVADVEQVADGLLMGFSQFVSGLFTIVGTLGILFFLNWIIALALFCLTPISLLVARFISKGAYHSFTKQAEIRGKQTALMNEMVSGLKTVQAYGYEETALHRFNEINEDLKRITFRATFFSSLTNPLTRFVNALIYACVVTLSAFLCIGGGILGATLSVGMLSGVLTYANQYTKPFNEITSVLAELQNAFACLGRIFTFLGEEEEVSDQELPALTAKGEVSVENVNFSYREDKPLLQNFNLKVERGQKTAIVGPTGCGKTTLINLLMRFYDVNDGVIQVDGNPVTAVTRKSLRESYGMVLQDTWIMQGTVAENVALGKPNATREEIETACRLSHAHGFISRLPNGYDTVISDGGGLSVGERQLLCIARVMLLRPPMLILDEATSSVDTRTEKRITDAFHLLMEGKTSFIVAHRLSTIQQADRILVMKDGNVIEQGTHVELLAQKGFYAELYQSQFEGENVCANT